MLKEKVKGFLYYFLFKLIIEGLELFSLPSNNAGLPNLTKRNFSGHSFLRHGEQLERVQLAENTYSKDLQAVRVIHVGAVCFHSASCKPQLLKYLCFPILLS